MEIILKFSGYTLSYMSYLKLDYGRPRWTHRPVRILQVQMSIHQAIQTLTVLLFRGNFSTPMIMAGMKGG